MNLNKLNEYFEVLPDCSRIISTLKICFKNGFNADLSIIISTHQPQINESINVIKWKSKSMKLTEEHFGSTMSTNQSHNGHLIVTLLISGIFPGTLV
jgi:hypothetical protein